MNEHFQDEIENKPKLRYFVLFKIDVKIAKYATAKLNQTQISLLAKTRSGTLCLAVEAGRFRSIPLENRLCDLCNSSVKSQNPLCMPVPHFLQFKEYGIIRFGIIKCITFN